MLKWPSTLEPAPKGIIGILYFVQIFAIRETCSVVVGIIIAIGRVETLDVDASE